jgi:hypothetical protein
MPIIAIDLDGAEPSYMIDENGKLTKPMMALLNSAFGYRIVGMQNATWHHTDTKSFFANTVKYQIGYNPNVNNFLENTDPLEWISFWSNLIVHEQKHRDEYENENVWLLWSMRYGMETILWESIISPDGKVNFYNVKTPTEQRAYKMELPMVDLMNFQNGMALKILESSYDEGTQVEALNYLGTAFQLEQATNKLNAIKGKAESNGKISKGENKRIKKAEETVNLLSAKAKALKTDKVTEVLKTLEGVQGKVIRMPDVPRHKEIRKTGKDPGPTKKE